MSNSSSVCLTGVAPLILETSSSCNLGFFCPNNSNIHPPQYCPPTIECQIRRLQTVSNICLEPQGTYEPIVCKAGHYCPLGGKEILPCPKGWFCPIGTYEPFACSAASICPIGSGRQFVDLTGFIAIIIIDLMLLVVLAAPSLSKRLRAISRRPHSSLDLELPLTAVRATPASKDGVASAPRQELIVLEGDDGQDRMTAASLSLFISSLKKCMGVREVGLTFGFEGLGFRLKKSNKSILADLTGHIGSGVLWGVMGASGAGKSTFVNLLRGRVKNTTGHIVINGLEKDISDYKKIIGYVPQDDVVMPELTVRENILHSARIRLPPSWSDKEIQTHVDILLDCLQLAFIKDNPVGDSINPMISGGQRKRVSIGIELAAAPMALFLDEPTSGLDSTSALSIINLLKALSRLGVTVVCIIHQPRSEIFFALDHLLLLAAGRQVFQGKTSDAIGYFENMGFRVPEHCNPADVIMDIIAGQGYKYSGQAEGIDVPRLIQSWERVESPAPIDNAISDGDQMAALARFATSRGARWYRQIYLCLVRSIKQQWRQANSFYLEIGVGAIAGLLIGLSTLKVEGFLFQGIYHPPYELLSSAVDYTLVPELGLLCSLAIGLAAAAPGVKIFGEEKSIYWREASAGHSRSAYYVGKVLATFFRLCLSALHFTVFYYALASPIMPFASLFAVNLLYFYCIYGLASCVSMVTRREDGPLLSMIVSLIIGIFNGYGPSLSTIKSWHLEWFWRLCPGTWLSEAYFTAHLQPLSYLYNLDAAAAWTGYTLYRFPLDAIMLFIIGTVYRIIGYAGLTLLDRDKQA